MSINRSARGRCRKIQADLSILSPSAYDGTVGLEIGKSKQYAVLNVQSEKCFAIIKKAETSKDNSFAVWRLFRQSETASPFSETVPFLFHQAVLQPRGIPSHKDLSDIAGNILSGSHCLYRRKHRAPPPPDPKAHIRRIRR